MTGDELRDELLVRRGITTPEAVEAFLNPDYDAHTHNPALLADMDRAVTRVLNAVERGEHVTVYADFDSDGIPAAVVLSDLFAKVGHRAFDVYIPHRDREGYGFHTNAIDTLVERGTTLIITVDVGIAAHETVVYAREKGIDVIVTDHHELNGVLPDAYAVINPKREGYPFSDLCGAAVAYKLAQALITEGRRRELRAFCAISDGWEKWLLDMVGIATIADMVPLVGENRVLAHYGLLVLRKTERPGIIALLRKLRLRANQLTEDDISFLIAPRINAASRMDEPELAFRLLATHDVREAEALAGELERLNRKRRAAVAATVRDVRRRIRERNLAGAVVVLGDPQWKPALLGLAANSILDDGARMVCLWGRDAAGKLKGSCRSDGAASVVDMFTQASDVLESFGGHHASGGFAVSPEHAHELPAAFEKGCTFNESSDIEAARHDAELAITEVTRTTYRTIAPLAPFGVANPKPLFRLARAQVAALRRFGKGEEHIEVTLRDEHGNTAQAIRFFADEATYGTHLQPERVVCVLASLEQSFFGGGSSVRLRLEGLISPTDDSYDTVGS